MRAVHERGRYIMLHMKTLSSHLRRYVLKKKTNNGHFRQKQHLVIHTWNRIESGNHKEQNTIHVIVRIKSKLFIGH